MGKILIINNLPKRLCKNELVSNIKTNKYLINILKESDRYVSVVFFTPYSMKSNNSISQVHFLLRNKRAML